MKASLPKRLFVFALFFSLSYCLLACAKTVPALPPELVDIWASDAATLRDNKWLISGQALYPAADGSGAIVSGPPPIGIPIRAAFDAQQNRLSIELLEQREVAQTLQIPYAPRTKTVNTGTAESPQTLSKRSDVMDAHMQQGLGL